jgi:N-dimethylarginine dimethylaminohydrolase
LVTLRKAKNPTKPELDMPDSIDEPNVYNASDSVYDTPSQSPFPVFVLCQPCFVDTKIKNNIWMKKAKGKEVEIDHEAFMGEWWNFYQLVSHSALVYLLPPTRGLQDQVYVNSFVYLPHVVSRDTIILSNFTAPGRAGEEIVAGKFLESMGYLCIKSPYKFEGEPELKWLKDNIYFGGWGIRSEIQAHKWIEKNFDAEIITIQEKDEWCYHLDCNLFVLNEENVMCCTETIDKATIKKIEKVANIFPVTKENCYEDICNIVRAGDMIICASGIEFMKDSDPLYELQKKKNDRLEKICHELGLEITFLQMDENAKSGAATSCLVSHLNYIY